MQADALGSRDGSVRVRLRSPPTGDWVEFAASSPLVQRVFLWVPWYFFIHKSNIFKFQFDQDRRPAKADVASTPGIVNVFILLNNRGIAARKSFLKFNLFIQGTPV